MLVTDRKALIHNTLGLSVCAGGMWHGPCNVTVRKKGTEAMRLKIIALTILVVIDQLLFPCQATRIHPAQGSVVN
jgi:hypothetical protein